MTMPMQPPSVAGFQWVVDAVIRGIGEFVDALPDVLSYGIAGDTWPQANEALLRELADRWDDLHRELQSAQSELASLMTAVSDRYGGDAGRELQQASLSVLGFEGESGVMQLGQAAMDQRMRVVQGALEVQLTKYTIAMEAIVTVVSVMWAIYSAFFTGGVSSASVGPLVTAGRRAALIRAAALLRRVTQFGTAEGFRRLSLRGLAVAAVEGVQEIVEEGTIEAGAQGLQMLLGDREGFDWDRIMHALVAGFAGGVAGTMVFGETFFGLGNRYLARQLRQHRSGDLLLRVGQGAAQNPVSSGFGAWIATNYQDHGWSGLLDGGASNLLSTIRQGALSAAVVGATRAGFTYGGGRLGLRMSPIQVDPLTGLVTVRPTRGLPPGHVIPELVPHLTQAQRDTALQLVASGEVVPHPGGPAAASGPGRVVLPDGLATTITDVFGGSGYVNPAALEGLFAGNGDLRVTIEYANVDEQNRVHVGATIADAGGNRVGSMTRVLGQDPDGTRYVEDSSTLLAKGPAQPSDGEGGRVLVNQVDSLLSEQEARLGELGFSELRRPPGGVAAAAAAARGVMFGPDVPTEQLRNALDSAVLAVTHDPDQARGVVLEMLGVSPERASAADTGRADALLDRYLDEAGSLRERLSGQEWRQPTTADVLRAGPIGATALNTVAWAGVKPLGYPAATEAPGAGAPTGAPGPALLEALEVALASAEDPDQGPVVVTGEKLVGSPAAADALLRAALVDLDTAVSDPGSSALGSTEQLVDDLRGWAAHQDRALRRDLSLAVDALRAQLAHAGTAFDLLLVQGWPAVQAHQLVSGHPGARAAPEAMSELVGSLDAVRARAAQTRARLAAHFSNDNLWSGLVMDGLAMVDATETTGVLIGALVVELAHHTGASHQLAGELVRQILDARLAAGDNGSGAAPATVDALVESARSHLRAPGDGATSAAADLLLAMEPLLSSQATADGVADPLTDAWRRARAATQQYADQLGRLTDAAYEHLKTRTAASAEAPAAPDLESDVALQVAGPARHGAGSVLSPGSEPIGRAAVNGVDGTGSEGSGNNRVPDEETGAPAGESPDQPVSAEGAGGSGGAGTPGAGSVGDGESGRASLQDLVARSTEEAVNRKDEIVRKVRDALRGVRIGEAGHTLQLRQKLDGEPDVTVEAGQTVLRHDVYDAQGRLVGGATFVVAIDRDGLFVEHVRIKLQSGSRRQGFLRSWHEHLEAWARESGVSRFRVLAEDEAGALPWMRFGFGPDVGTDHQVRPVLVAMRRDHAEAERDARQIEAHLAGEAGVDLAVLLDRHAAGDPARLLDQLRRELTVVGSFLQQAGLVGPGSPGYLSWTDVSRTNIGTKALWGARMGLVKTLVHSEGESTVHDSSAEPGDPGGHHQSDPQAWESYSAALAQDMVGAVVTLARTLARSDYQTDHAVPATQLDYYAGASPDRRLVGELARYHPATSVREAVVRLRRLLDAFQPVVLGSYLADDGTVIPPSRRPQEAAEVLLRAAVAELEALLPVDPRLVRVALRRRLDAVLDSHNASQERRVELTRERRQSDRQLQNVTRGTLPALALPEQLVRLLYYTLLAHEDTARLLLAGVRAGEDPELVVRRLSQDKLTEPTPAVSAANLADERLRAILDEIDPGGAPGGPVPRPAGEPGGTPAGTSAVPTPDPDSDQEGLSGPPPSADTGDESGGQATRHPPTSEVGPSPFGEVVQGTLDERLAGVARSIELTDTPDGQGVHGTVTLTGRRKLGLTLVTTDEAHGASIWTPVGQRGAVPSVRIEVPAAWPADDQAYSVAERVSRAVRQMLPVRPGRVAAAQLATNRNHADARYLTAAVAELGNPDAEVDADPDQGQVRVTVGSGDSLVELRARRGIGGAWSRTLQEDGRPVTEIWLSDDAPPSRMREELLGQLARLDQSVSDQESAPAAEPPPGPRPDPPTPSPARRGGLRALAFAAVVALAGRALPAPPSPHTTPVREPGPAVSASDTGVAQADLVAEVTAAAQPAPEPPATTTYTNPVAENFADPAILHDGDLWYAYSTNSWAGHLPVMVSPDLVNWLPGPDAMPVLGSWAEEGRTWAPDVVKVAEGRYLLYYTARVAGTDRQAIGVAEATEPAGPFVDRSAEPLITMPDAGGAIDASVFTDDDGTRYLYWKNDGNAVGQPTHLWGQRLSPDGQSLVGEPAQLLTNDQPWQGHVVEAPQMVKRNGVYYLFYSGNAFDSEAYAVGVAYGRTPLAGFENLPGNPILTSSEDAAGPGHSYVVQTPDGRWWSFYHAWRPGEVGNPEVGRELHVEELGFVAGEPVDVPVLLGPVSGPMPAPQTSPPAATRAARPAADPSLAGQAPTDRSRPPARQVPGSQERTLAPAPRRRWSAVTPATGGPPDGGPPDGGPPEPPDPDDGETSGDGGQNGTPAGSPEPGRGQGRGEGPPDDPPAPTGESGGPDPALLARLTDLAGQPGAELAVALRELAGVFEAGDRAFAGYPVRLRRDSDGSPAYQIEEGDLTVWLEVREPDAGPDGALLGTLGLLLGTKSGDPSYPDGTRYARYDLAGLEASASILHELHGQLRAMARESDLSHIETTVTGENPVTSLVRGGFDLAPSTRLADLERMLAAIREEHAAHAERSDEVARQLAERASGPDESWQLAVVEDQLAPLESVHHRARQSLPGMSGFPSLLELTSAVSFEGVELSLMDDLRPPAERVSARAAELDGGHFRPDLAREASAAAAQAPDPVEAVYRLAWNVAQADSPAEHTGVPIGARLAGLLAGYPPARSPAEAASRLDRLVGVFQQVVQGNYLDEHRMLVPPSQHPREAADLLLLAMSRDLEVLLAAGTDPGDPDPATVIASLREAIAAVHEVYQSLGVLRQALVGTGLSLAEAYEADPVTSPRNLDAFAAYLDDRGRDSGAVDRVKAAMRGAGDADGRLDRLASGGRPPRMLPTGLVDLVYETLSVHDATEFALLATARRGDPTGPVSRQIARWKTAPPDGDPDIATLAARGQWAWSHLSEPVLYANSVEIDIRELLVDLRTQDQSLPEPAPAADPLPTVDEGPPPWSGIPESAEELVELAHHVGYPIRANDPRTTDEFVNQVVTGVEVLAGGPQDRLARAVEGNLTALLAMAPTALELAEFLGDRTLPGRPLAAGYEETRSAVEFAHRTTRPSPESLTVSFSGLGNPELRQAAAEKARRLWELGQRARDQRQELADLATVAESAVDVDPSPAHQRELWRAGLAQAAVDLVYRQVLAYEAAGQLTARADRSSWDRPAVRELVRAVADLARGLGPEVSRDRGHERLDRLFSAGPAWLGERLSGGGGPVGARIAYELLDRARQAVAAEQELIRLAGGGPPTGGGRITQALSPPGGEASSSDTRPSPDLPTAPAGSEVAAQSPPAVTAGSRGGEGTGQPPGPPPPPGGPQGPRGPRTPDLVGQVIAYLTRLADAVQGEAGQQIRDWLAANQATAAAERDLFDLLLATGHHTPDELRQVWAESADLDEMWRRLRGDGTALPGDPNQPRVEGLLAARSHAMARTAEAERALAGNADLLEPFYPAVAAGFGVVETAVAMATDMAARLAVAGAPMPAADQIAGRVIDQWLAGNGWPADQVDESYVESQRATLAGAGVSGPVVAALAGQLASLRLGGVPDQAIDEVAGSLARLAAAADRDRAATAIADALGELLAPVPGWPDGVVSASSWSQAVGQAPDVRWAGIAADVADYFDGDLMGSAQPAPAGGAPAELVLRFRSGIDGPDHTGGVRFYRGDHPTFRWEDDSLVLLVPFSSPGSHLAAGHIATAVAMVLDGHGPTQAPPGAGTQVHQITARARFAAPARRLASGGEPADVAAELRTELAQARAGWGLAEDSPDALAAQVRQLTELFDEASGQPLDPAGAAARAEALTGLLARHGFRLPDRTGALLAQWLTSVLETELVRVRAVPELVQSGMTLVLAETLVAAHLSQGEWTAGDAQVWASVGLDGAEALHHQLREAEQRSAELAAELAPALSAAGADGAVADRLAALVQAELTVHAGDALGLAELGRFGIGPADLVDQVRERGDAPAARDAARAYTTRALERNGLPRRTVLRLASQLGALAAEGLSSVAVRRLVGQITGSADPAAAAEQLTRSLEPLLTADARRARSLAHRHNVADQRTTELGHAIAVSSRKLAEEALRPALTEAALEQYLAVTEATRDGRTATAARTVAGRLVGMGLPRDLARDLAGPITTAQSGERAPIMTVQSAPDLQATLTGLGVSAHTAYALAELLGELGRAGLRPVTRESLIDHLATRPGRQESAAALARTLRDLMAGGSGAPATGYRGPLIEELGGRIAVDRLNQHLQGHGWRHPLRRSRLGRATVSLAAPVSGVGQEKQFSLSVNRRGYVRPQFTVTVVETTQARTQLVRASHGQVLIEVPVTSPPEQAIAELAVLIGEQVEERSGQRSSVLGDDPYPWRLLRPGAVSAPDIAQFHQQFTEPLAALARTDRSDHTEWVARWRDVAAGLAALNLRTDDYAAAERLADRVRAAGELALGALRDLAELPPGGSPPAPAGASSLALDLAAVVGELPPRVADALRTLVTRVQGSQERRTGLVAGLASARVSWLDAHQAADLALVADAAERHSELDQLLADYQPEVRDAARTAVDELADVQHQVVIAVRTMLRFGERGRLLSLLAGLGMASADLASSAPTLRGALVDAGLDPALAWTVVDQIRNGGPAMEPGAALLAAAVPSQMWPMTAVMLGHFLTELQQAGVDQETVAAVRRGVLTAANPQLAATNLLDPRLRDLVEVMQADANGAVTLGLETAAELVSTLEAAQWDLLDRWIRPAINDIEATLPPDRVADFREALDSLGVPRNEMGVPNAWVHAQRRGAYAVAGGLQEYVNQVIDGRHWLGALRGLTQVVGTGLTGLLDQSFKSEAAVARLFQAAPSTAETSRRRLPPAVVAYAAATVGKMYLFPEGVVQDVAASLDKLADQGGRAAADAYMGRRSAAAQSRRAAAAQLGEAGPHRYEVDALLAEAGGWLADISQARTLAPDGQVPPEVRQELGQLRASLVTLVGAAEQEARRTAAAPGEPAATPDPPLRTYVARRALHQSLVAGVGVVGAIALANPVILAGVVGNLVGGVFLARHEARYDQQRADPSSGFTEADQAYAAREMAAYIDRILSNAIPATSRRSRLVRWQRTRRALGLPVIPWRDPAGWPRRSGMNPLSRQPMPDTRPHWQRAMAPAVGYALGFSAVAAVPALGVGLANLGVAAGVGYAFSIGQGWREWAYSGTRVPEARFQFRQAVRLRQNIADPRTAPGSADQAGAQVERLRELTDRADALGEQATGRAAVPVPAGDRRHARRSRLVKAGLVAAPILLYLSARALSPAGEVTRSPQDADKPPDRGPEQVVPEPPPPAPEEPIEVEPEPAEPGPGQPPLVYEVARGDRLWDVAERFLGDGGRYPEIAALNQPGYEGFPDLIFRGQELVLPPGVIDHGPQPHATGTTRQVEPPPPAAPTPQPPPRAPEPGRASNMDPESTRPGPEHPTGDESQDPPGTTPVGTGAAAAAAAGFGAARPGRSRREDGGSDGDTADGHDVNVPARARARGEESFTDLRPPGPVELAARQLANDLKPLLPWRDELGGTGRWLITLRQVAPETGGPISEPPADGPRSPDRDEPEETATEPRPAADGAGRGSGGGRRRNGQSTADPDGPDPDPAEGRPERIRATEVARALAWAADSRTAAGGVDGSVAAGLLAALPRIDTTAGVDAGLAAFVGGTLGREVSLVPVGAGAAKGVSGAPVSLVRDGSGEVVAVTKLFPMPVEGSADPHGYELVRELSALERLRSPELTRFGVPDPLAVGVIETPGGSAGVLVSTVAPGSSIDDLIRAAAEATGGERDRRLAMLARAVAATAESLAELHTGPPGSGETVAVGYLDRRAQVVRQRMDEALADRPGYEGLAGLPVEDLSARLDRFIEASRHDPQGAAIIHGDAHPGNFFWSPDEGITFIDTSTLHSSLDHRGRPVGPPEHDVVLFAELLVYLGREAGLDAAETDRLREGFLGAYHDAGGAELDRNRLRLFAADNLSYRVGLALERMRTILDEGGEVPSELEALLRHEAERLIWAMERGRW